jgi:signal transduction histidine kinase
MSDTKGHLLEVAPVPTEAVLYVDPIRVTMALTNVLNNAITFTEAGGHIRVETQLASSAEAWITVTDDGIGIAPDQLERIFEPFYQVEDHMVRRHGGIGIGLSIARALAEANGGRIWASSAGLGHGAAFTLALPLAKAAETR